MICTLINTRELFPEMQEDDSVERSVNGATEGLQACGACPCCCVEPNVVDAGPTVLQTQMRRLTFDGIDV